VAPKFVTFRLIRLSHILFVGDYTEDNKSKSMGVKQELAMNNYHPQMNNEETLHPSSKNQ